MSFKYWLLVLLISVLCLSLTSSGHAAIGDVAADCQNVAASGNLDIQPPGTDEWIIYNITFTKNVEFQRYDGTLTSGEIQWIGPDWQNFIPGFYINNTDRIRIVNLDGALANRICYDGIQTG